MSDTAPPQVVIVQKNSSGCKILLIILGVIALIGVLLVGGCFAVGVYTVSKVSEKVEEENKKAEVAAMQLKVSELSWEQTSSGERKANFKVTNNNEFEVKNMVIEVTFSGEGRSKSEKILSRNIKSKETIKITNFIPTVLPNTGKPESIQIIRAF